MDDIKLITKNDKELKTLITSVRIYSENIIMEFGIEKWAMLMMKNGKRKWRKERNYQIKKKTINRQYNASELRQLKEAIKLKSIGKLRVLWSSHCSYCSNWSNQPCLKILLTHQTARSDVYMLSKLNFYLRGYHFVNNDEVTCSVEEVLEDQAVNFLCDEIAMLENRRTKCIDVKGDNIEKWWKTV